MNSTARSIRFFTALGLTDRQRISDCQLGLRDDQIKQENVNDEKKKNDSGAACGREILNRRQKSRDKRGGIKHFLNHVRFINKLSNKHYLWERF